MKTIEEFNSYIEEFEFDSSVYTIFKILKNGNHVGHRLCFWDERDDIFSPGGSFTLDRFKELKEAMHWIVASEDEDGGLLLECNSWERFLCIIAILEGDCVLNAHLIK